MAKLNKRLAASTLLEVIVAMVIIIIVFSIALMIFSNVSRMSFSARQLRGEALAQSNMPDRLTTDSIFQDSTWKIERKTITSENFTPLKEVTITVYDENGQKVTALKRLIRCL